MPVDQTQLRIDPYQSTVPLVQVPPEQIDQQTRPAAPLQGQFGRKGTGALAIGDSLMKGFLQGHALKEERKNKEAMAQYQSGSAQIAAAKATYQQAVDSGQAKPNDPNDPAFIAYQKATAPILAQLDPLTIPQKQPKGQKKNAKEEFQTLGQGIKGWMAANQHIIPSLAKLALMPQPLGKSQEGQQQQQQSTLNEQAVTENNLKIEAQKKLDHAREVVSMFDSLTPEQRAALPPDQQKAYDQAQTEYTQAKQYLDTETTGRSRSTYVYKLADGSFGRFTPYDAPKGASLYVAGQESKPGTPGFYLEKKARELGKQVNDLTTDEILAAMSEQAAARVPTRSSTTSSTTDEAGNRTSTTTSRATPATPGRVTAPPNAPKTTASPAGSVTAPPQPRAAAPTAGGGVTAPPQKMTLTQANRMRDWDRRSKDAEAAKAKGFSDAESKYQATVNKINNNANMSDADKAQAKKDAETLRNSEQQAAASAYDMESQRLQQEQGTLAPKGSGGKGQAPAPPAGATMAYKDPKTGAVVGWAVNGQYVAAQR